MSSTSESGFADRLPESVRSSSLHGGTVDAKGQRRDLRSDGSFPRGHAQHAAAKADLVKHVQHDIEFHNVFYELSGSELLEDRLERYFNEDTPLYERRRPALRTRLERDG